MPVLTVGLNIRIYQLELQINTVESTYTTEPVTLQNDRNEEPNDNPSAEKCSHEIGDLGRGLSVIIYSDTVL